MRPFSPGRPMPIWGMILMIFIAGCTGGLVNALLTGELKLPARDPHAGVYRPGWMGNVLVGGAAGLALWGLYGPTAGSVVYSTAGDPGPDAVLRLSELVGALVTGIAGGRVITTEVEKKLLVKESEHLGQAKSSLSEVVEVYTKEAA